MALIFRRCFVDPGVSDGARADDDSMEELRGKHPPTPPSRRATISIET